MRTRITAVAAGLVLIVMTTAGGALTGAAIDAGVGAAAGPVSDWSR